MIEFGISSQISPDVQIDPSDFFKAKNGAWFKTAGGKQSLYLNIPVAGVYPTFLRARTGSATNATYYTDGYAFYVNDVPVTLAFDTSKPNVKRDEFGGSYIGYFSGKVNWPAGIVKFTVEGKKQFAGFDSGYIEESTGGITGISETQYNTDVKAAYDKGYADAKATLYTKEQRDAYAAEQVKLATTNLLTQEAVNKLIADAVLKATNDQKIKDTELINALIVSLVNNAKGIMTNADALIKATQNFSF